MVSEGACTIGGWHIRGSMPFWGRENERAECPLFSAGEQRIQKDREEKVHMRGQREEVARGVVVGILFSGVEITTPVLVVLLSRDEIAARKRLLVFPEQPLTPRTDKAQLRCPRLPQGSREAIIVNLRANKRILISWSTSTSTMCPLRLFCLIVQVVNSKSRSQKSRKGA